METLKLVVVFLAIVVILKFDKPLWLAIIGAVVSASFLYGISWFDTLLIAGKSLTSLSTITLLLTFYLITFLQRMLEERGALRIAQQSLYGIFNNRRINASLAPIFIGLLPSPAVVTICGAIVDEASENYLTVEEKAFVASYYRHIPESFLPTYPSIILGVQLSGVELSSYLYGMLPMVFVLVGLGYAFQLRKLPPHTGRPKSEHRGKDFAALCRSIWTIALVVIMTIVLRMPVYAAALIIIILYVFTGNFIWSEIWPIFRTAVESKLLASTAVILVFRDIISATGVIELLPDLFLTLPIPPYLVFFLIFCFGTIISGNMATIAICLPLAFGAIPNAGVALLVLLLSTGYIGMQISPTHICLAVVTDYFKINMGSLVKKTIPVLVSFSAILIGYYLLLVNMGL
jgi:integral membrane protein (TIGR00529 family)